MKKVIIRKVIKKNYHFAKYFATRKYKLDLDKPNVILVYTMGKVGSSSVYRSLKLLDPSKLNGSVYFIHYVNKKLLDRAENHEKERYTKDYQLYEYLRAGRYLQRQIGKGFDFKKKLKIITGVRDIVSADISGFFHSLYRNPSFKYDRIFKEDLDKISEELMQLFLKEKSSDRWVKWFNNELKSVMGLDVFATNFPKQKGFQIYRGDFPDTVLYRLEDLEKNLQQIGQEFLGIKNLKLNSINIGNDKEYSEVYKKFMTKIQLPKDYLDQVYSSQLMTHFYTSEEIENFRMKWKTI